jgi:hypothetical protein
LSRIAQIVAFVRMAQGGLSTDTLAKAIRRRWPDASNEEIREAVARAATGMPNDADERAAMDAAAMKMLGKADE